MLQADLAELTAQFGKPALVAETAYPFTLASNDPAAALSFSDPAGLDPGYPATPAGQAASPSPGDSRENQAMWDYSDVALPVIADFAPR